MVKPITSINLDKHIITKSSSHIREIAQPLREEKINYFSYCKINKGGTVQLFSTHPELEVKFVQEKLYETMFCANYNEYTNSVYMWDDLKTIDLNSFVNSSGLDYGLVITRRLDDYSELFFFALDMYSDFSPSFYLNKLVYLYKFIDYFLIQADHLIEESWHDRFYFPNGNDKTILTQGNQFSTSLEETFHGETFKLLTKCEKKCLIYLGGGSTAKEMARQLNCSSRTIEKHLQNIRRKFQVNRTSALISLILPYIEEKRR